MFQSNLVGSDVNLLQARVLSLSIETTNILCEKAKLPLQLYAPLPDNVIKVFTQRQHSLA